METASEIKAFNKLFADYHGLFVRFANTYLQDEAAAEDIAVEGIMYYWENRHSLSSDSNIPAYILEAIKHKCLNYLRSSSCPRRCGTTYPGASATGE